MPAQPITDADLADLRGYAASRHVTAADLDEVVYELANSGAANAYNNGAEPGLDDDAAHEQLHDQADSAASTINNSGLTGQLRYLAGHTGTAGARDLIDRAAEH